jgi:hypothetical protein
MHPSGVQFGLSRELLQLRGEEVLLSDQLLETISVEAQPHFERGGPPTSGNFLVDITVRAAQDFVGTQNPGLRLSASGLHSRAGFDVFAKPEAMGFSTPGVRRAIRRRNCGSVFSRMSTEYRKVKPLQSCHFNLLIK